MTQPSSQYTELTEEATRAILLNLVRRIEHCGAGLALTLTTSPVYTIAVRKPEYVASSEPSRRYDFASAKECGQFLVGMIAALQATMHWLP